MANTSFPINPTPSGIQPMVLGAASISQTGFTVTVTLPAGSFPDIQNVGQPGDPIVIAFGDTTWNGTHYLASVGAETFTFASGVSLSHSATNPSGFIFFPYATVYTELPTGFVAGQKLTIANADNAAYDGSYPCRYATGNVAVLYIGLNDPTSGGVRQQTASDVIPTDTTYNTNQWEVVGAAPHQLRTTGTTDGQVILLDYVVPANFAFSIPATALLLGFSPAVSFHSQQTSNSYVARVGIYSGGVLVGTAETPASAAYFTTATQTLVMGGSSDLFGTSLTISNVNNTAFGFGVQVFHNRISGVTSQRLFIDSFSMTVYYAIPLPNSGGGTLSGDLPDPPSPITVTLVAVPTSITIGQNSTLTWTSTGATEAILTSTDAAGNQIVNRVLLNDSEIVTPIVTTDYSLVAMNSGGSLTATARVTVTDAPTATLTADPSNINAWPNLVVQAKDVIAPGCVSVLFASNVTAGNLLIVTFSAEGDITGQTIVDSVSTVYTKVAAITGQTYNLNVWAGAAGASGANTVTIAGAIGSASQNTSVMEVSGCTATVDATASVYNTSSNPSTLNIATTNAQDFIFAVVAGDSSFNTFSFGDPFTLNAQANGQGSGVAIGGVLVNGATTYTLKYLTVTGPLTNQPVILVAFRANAFTAPTSTLTWTTTNSVSAAIDQSIGSVALNGNTQVSPRVTTLYTLTATGSTGAIAKASALVVVQVPGKPPVHPPVVVLSPQPYKLIAMSQGSPYTGLGITDQDSGFIYGATGRGTLDTAYFGLDNSALGRSGIVTDNGGNFWYSNHFNVETGVGFCKVIIKPPSPPVLMDRSEWIITASTTTGGHGVALAVDNDITTYWGPVALQSAVLTVDTGIAGEPLDVVSVYTGPTDGAILSSIDISDDGITYTNVWSTSTAMAQGKQYYFYVGKQSCRYFKVSFNGSFPCEVAELYAGVTFGDTQITPTFNTSEFFSITYGGTTGININPGRYGLAYRASDNKLLLANGHSLQVFDQNTQTLGASYTTPDTGTDDLTVYVANVSTNGFALIYSGDHVYLVDSSMAQQGRWSRAVIDPVNSLYGPIQCARWNPTPNILWAVTDDGIDARLFKIDMAGPSVTASAVMGTTGTWSIEIDSSTSIVAVKKGNSAAPNDDAYLHVFDQTTLAQTTYALPDNSGANPGNNGPIGVNETGLVATQGSQPFFTAPVWLIDPANGTVHSSAWEWGGIFDLPGDPAGQMFAFSSSSGFSTTAAGPVIGPVTIVFTLGSISAGGGGEGSQAMLLMPAFNAGDRRAQKQFGDLFVEAEVANGSSITLALWQSQYEAVVASYSPATLSPANGGLRSPYVVNLTSDGLMAVDLEAIVSWPLSPRISLITWQPTVIGQPESVQSRPTDWDSAGTPGNKFIQGMMLEYDSFGVGKTFGVQRSDDGGVYIPVECPSIAFGQRTESFTFDPPFLAHDMRIVSGDGVPWRIYSYKYIFQPYPEQSVAWQTEMVSFGTGWNSIFFLNLAHISTADLTLTLTFDQGPIASITITVPNSGGQYIKTKVTLGFNKFKAVSFKVASTQKATIFARDLECWIKSWGSTGSFAPVKPFGGPSNEGAEV